MKRKYCLVFLAVLLILGVALTSCASGKDVIDFDEISDSAVDETVLANDIGIVRSKVEFRWHDLCTPVLVVRDENGIRIREEGLINTVEYEYAENGHIKRMTTHRFAYTETWVCEDTEADIARAYLEGEIINNDSSYYTFAYNNGVLTTIQFTDAYYGSTDTYEYDEVNNLVRISSSDSTIDFEYEDGFLSTATINSTEGGSVRKYEYDKEQRIVTADFYDISDDSFFSREIYYEEDGYDIYEVYNVKDDGSYELDCLAKYKDDGIWTVAKGYENGKIDVSIYLLRDEQGTIYYREYETYESDGTGVREIYELDSVTGELVLVREEAIVK